MREKSGSTLSDMGPSPRSSVDWFFTPRPGRILDAAELEPADPAELETEMALASEPGTFRRVFQRIISPLDPSRSITEAHTESAKSKEGGKVEATD